MHSRSLLSGALFQYWSSLSSELFFYLALSFFLSVSLSERQNLLILPDHVSKRQLVSSDLVAKSVKIVTNKDSDQ